MRLIKEFKEFAFRGNLIDLAIGVILGAAFGKIVNSVVENLIMPCLGFFTPESTNLKNLKITLKQHTNQQGVPDGELAIKYGVFLEEIINFLIISFVIFMFVKFINQFHKKQKSQTPPPKPSNEEKILGEIRDLIKVQKNPL